MGSIPCPNCGAPGGEFDSRCVACGTELPLSSAAPAKDGRRHAGAGPAEDPIVGRGLAHYRVLRGIGAGGMGAVYAAEDTRLGRNVALKILPPAMASEPERLERFQREARVVASLNHPNVVTLHSVEEAEGLHFLVMELVQGRTLDTLLPVEGMGLGQLLELAVPIAAALGAAQRRRILHRDLKLTNVMLSDEGTVKVLDFGLAKLWDESPAAPPGLEASHLQEPADLPTEVSGDVVTPSHASRSVDTPLLSGHALTASGQVLGTLPYMSPEQVQGRPLDQRSDLFSFGVLLYELATGRRPFHGATRAELSNSILGETPPRVASLRPDLPPALDLLLERCLAKDPADRFQTAPELQQALELLKNAGPAAQAETPGREVAAETPAARLEPVELASKTKLLGGHRMRLLSGLAALTVAAFAGFHYRYGGWPFRGTPAEAPIHTSTVTLSGGVPLELAWVPGGAYWMGCSPGDPTCDRPPFSSDFLGDKPRHQVEVGGFWMGRYELSWRQWRAVMQGSSPAHFPQCDDCPAAGISWDAAQEFLSRAGQGLRLPTEAEWERGARGGTEGFRYGSLQDVAWIVENSGLKPHPVGQKKPNAYGLYDTLGNVSEWCLDRYVSYPGAVEGVPPGTSLDRLRVFRGGSWLSLAVQTRVSHRFKDEPSWPAPRSQDPNGPSPEASDESIGFRVVQDLQPGQIDTLSLPGGVQLAMVWIPPGDFWMGCSPGDQVCDPVLPYAERRPLFEKGCSRQDENCVSEDSRDPSWIPRKQVSVAGFWMGRTEVTQAQWQAVMGDNPSYFKNCGPDCPVEQVSFDDIQVFLEKAGQGLQLPAEKQWEYAGRAGTDAALYTGSMTILGGYDSPELGRVAWYGGNSPVDYETDAFCRQRLGQKCGTHPVARKLPNAWGLHDMLGNVFEWCTDHDAAPPETRGYILRGGSWYNPIWRVRLSRQDGHRHFTRANVNGFRVIRTDSSPLASIVLPAGTPWRSWPMFGGMRR